MKRFFCILLAALLLLTLAACSKAPEADPADEAPDWQAQYDLGVRYLSEGNYEEAILAFEAAIEIDPRNADAYLKLAQACEQREERTKSRSDRASTRRPSPVTQRWRPTMSRTSF